MKRHLVQVNFDRSASGYAAKYEHPTDFYASEKRRRMQLLVELAESIRPTAVLDAGCGPGVVLDELRRRLPEGRLLGTDLSRSMLRQARLADSGELPLVQSDVEHPPFADDSFDLIYALGVVDYTEDPRRFFQSAWRMLQPGGTLAFTYPNADCLIRMFRVSLRRYRGRVYGKESTALASPLSATTVDRLMTELGFRWVQRRFITYANGPTRLPGSLTFGRSMERWCGQRSLGRYLAWSCFCVVRKPNPIHGATDDL
ncbi:MAG: class I SAM-dependent methyltransferase [Thermoguttaceae bacterium]